VHRRRRRRCRCTMFKIAMSASRDPCLRCCHCRLLSPVWANAILNQRVTSALLALTALDHIDRPSDRELGAKVLGRRCVSNFYACSRPRRPRHKEDYSSLVGVARKNSTLVPLSTDIYPNKHETTPLYTHTAKRRSGLHLTLKLKRRVQNSLSKCCS
jgi:hypothetical protein